MELGKVIQQERKAQGLSTELAAARARISLSYWQKLEAGQMGNPSFTVLKRIAEALSVSVGHLSDKAMAE